MPYAKTASQSRAFPFNHFVDSVVQLLSAVKYEDHNYERADRIKVLQQTYTAAADHFAQQIKRGTLPMSLQKVEAILPTPVNLTVCSCPGFSQEVVSAIAIYWTYDALLDDEIHAPDAQMVSFFEDLVQGREQTHWWFRLVNEHLMTSVLKHYGSFCKFTILRSSLDFFQGNWIERYGLQGFPGCHSFPLFLRRLNALGHIAAAFLFPKERFDEQTVFAEIACALPMVENIMIYVNDILSFYKEYDAPQDQNGLLLNMCAVEGISETEALSKLTQDTIRACQQIFTVFEGKDPRVEATAKAFTIGYITWHLYDVRYRMKEVYDRLGSRPVDDMFRSYYEYANDTVGADLAEWAEPTLSKRMARADR